MKRIGLLSRWALAIVAAILLGIGSSPGDAVAAPGATTRVSVSSAGAQGDGDSGDPSISSDGRYVAFDSFASNLVAGYAGDIFVRDRINGATTSASVRSSGVPASAWALTPSISGDGRFVAFLAYGSDLVPGDTNEASDIFVRDRVAGTTTRVSVSSSGVQGDNGSEDPSVSSDGRYVAFVSDADNLVAGDTNGAQDVFVRDLVAGTTTRVSVDSSGTQGDIYSQSPAVSADGRYVAFASDATNLVASDTNEVTDVFVRDLVAGTTNRVSVDSSGTQGDIYSQSPAVSADGRYVAFGSWASNLVPGDTNGTLDVFVHDRVTGATTRVSVSSAGGQGDHYSDGPSISADGRYVAFDSAASNLVAGDTNPWPDVFVHDRVTSATTQVSVSSSGVRGTGPSWHSSISADGRYVAFGSMVSNLVAGDTNGVFDVFVNEVVFPVTTSISIRTTATSVRTGAIPILSGAVTPNAMVGKNIVAYVKKPGKAYWTYSSNRTVYNKSGLAAWQYKYYFKPGMVKGYYAFKAVVPAWPGFLGSQSPTTVTIRLR